MFDLTGEQLVTIARFISAGFSIGLGAIGSALGIAYAALGALHGISLRPKRQGEYMRTMFISMAIAESTVIYALVIALMLLLVVGGGSTDGLFGVDWLMGARYLAAGLAMGAGALGAGYGIGLASNQALRGITRQPERSGALLRTMFLGIAVTESPAIYALVVSSLLIFVLGETQAAAAFTSNDLVVVAKYLGGGLAVGLGAIGAGVGLGMTAAGAAWGIARNPDKDNVLTRTMFLGMAVTESPAIYALVVSLILLFVIGVPLELGWAQGLHDFARFLGAGIAMGAGAIGPGLGIGIAAERALTGIARQPHQEGALVRTMFLGMAVTESTAIYSLVIALILLFAIS